MILSGRGVTAVLGPTNTGKTHLAIERMVAHSSGIIGLPLRLLAREVYGRVGEKVGFANVSLITGEEKIQPPGARYSVCTVEALPRQTNAAFVAIDEVQFLGSEIVEVAETLANEGIRVICAGLDLDFRAEPFGPIPALLSVAEDVTKLHAICVVCGEVACRSQRLVNGQPARYDDPIIMIGAQEAYEARCREHYEIPGKHA